LGVLVTGLIVFIGIHSLRMLGLRGAFARMLGETGFFIVYSIVSAVGLALIVYGHILAHPSATVWNPPVWTRSFALVAVPISLVLVVAAYLPTHIRSLIRHPMTLGIFLWAVAHFLANGERASLILFGALGAWSLLTLVTAYARGGQFEDSGNWGADLVAIVLGLGAAAALAWFHMQLFGVAVVGFASETAPPGI
jgi:uncharacterized membrane protein